MAKNKKIDPSDPAFPTTAPFDAGMETRTYMATQLGVGLLIRGANQPDKEIAKAAVKLADEIINQLNKDK